MLNDLDIHPHKKSWAFHVRHILQTYGFNEVWLFQGVGNVNVLMNLFMQRVQDNFMQLWSMEIEGSSRASLYKLFSKFELAFHLKNVSVKKFRTALTRLRMSSHNLEIEAGRWHRPNVIPRDERKCQLCNELEDEFHFILECPLYHELRVEYINRYYWRRPNIPRFIELLQSENANIIRKLAIFVQKSFEKRNRTFYDV